MKVSDFKNKHEGQKIFILGSGPSVHNLDLDLLKDKIVMTVNSSIAKYPNCNYMVSDDSDIQNWSYYDILKKSDCIKFLYKDKFKNCCQDLSNTILYLHTWWFSPEDKTYNLDGLKLTKYEPIIGARFSLASAVHIAYIMGADPIVIYGNDMKLSDSGKRYFWQFDGEDKQYRTDKRNFSKTQNRGFDEKAFKNYWKKFIKINKDINIICI